MTQRNIAASVRARLLEHARETRQDFNLILTRYALERAPTLRVYPRYTVVAEKLQTLVSLGIANSRMKDYFDLWILSRQSVFDGETLRRAVRATFDRRKTALPMDVPFGLSDGFVQDARKQTQWQAFLGKNRIEALNLKDVVALLREFLLPVTKAANANTPHPRSWEAGGPWSTMSN